jgi:ParB family chromosome partitioning protein
MSDALVRYDEACRAIAQARATDEVLKIRDQGAMLRAYARQAKNRELELTAVEIRMRAERRIGELMQLQRETVGLNKGANGFAATGSADDPVVPVKDPRPTLAEAGIDKHLADRARKLASLPPAKFEAAVTEWRADHTARADKVTLEILAPPHVTHNSGEIEWYTPSPYIEAARAVMGGIDLDPASSIRANDIVKADRIFTAADDGLAHAWRGRVWMNPPYASTLVQQFTAKLVQHVVAHELEAAIVLVNNATETRWFRAMADVADAVCFKTGRIQFHSPTKAAATGLQGQVFLYFGAEPSLFVEQFHPFGIVMIRANYVPAQFADEDMDLDDEVLRRARM